MGGCLHVGASDDRVRPSKYTRRDRACKRARRFENMRGAAACATMGACFDGSMRSQESSMLLQDIMTTRLVTVEMDDKLAVVKQIFDSMHFHHLLVVGEHKTLRGVVSDRDLLRALSPHIGTCAETTRDLATLNKRVHQIMAHAPVTLQSHATVAEAAALMLERSVSCIPVVDDERRPIGIVSWRDILRALAAPGTGT